VPPAAKPVRQSGLPFVPPGKPDRTPQGALRALKDKNTITEMLKPNHRSESTRQTLADFMLKEWLLFVAAAGLVVTSVYLRRFPGFSVEDVEITLLLAMLFISVKGLERSGVILRLSRSIEKGRFLPLKLVCAIFFLSMIVTNDVALIVLVPLTLALNTDRKDILVILEALAANAGSALTPIGNPQNLFIYWFYDVRPGPFIACIAPFSLVFLAVFILASLFLKTSRPESPRQDQEPVRIDSGAFIYGIFLGLVILTVLRIMPVYVAIAVAAYALLFDRKSLRIDYALILTLVGFLGLSENLKTILAVNLADSGHVFILTAISSQVLSNVPAALLFAKFTTHWRALLWGANVGGFGSLVGSLANLIAYKLYIADRRTRNSGAFTLVFILLGYIAFFIGILLYFAVGR